MEVVEATSAEDGMSVIVSDSAIHDDPHGLDARRRQGARQGQAACSKFVRSRNDKIPIFLMAERGEASAIPLDVMEMVNEYIWTLEDTAAFVGGRVVAASRRYLEVMLPPLAAALMQFSQEYEYSWHTPGHTGGTAFLKSPVGRIFFDYFGENLLRSDLSISVGDLGSLLDHTGPIGEHETLRGPRLRRAPHLLRHQRHVHVQPRDLHGRGRRGSDRAVRSQLPQVDRARPGADGRDPDVSRPAAQSLRDHRPHPAGAPDAGGDQGGDQGEPARRRRTSTARPVYSVVTNSTYDGLCYNARRVAELLDPSVDRIHFDEAWYAYARFNPIYRDRHAMHGDPKDHTGPTVFATHSTHKLLAALSQASLLHIRDGRSPIPHARFNESFMMHASTSPFYPIIVSNDVTAAMMDGPGGRALTDESIEEAVAFRQTMGRVHRQFAKQARLVLQHLERGHREGSQDRQEGPRSRRRRRSCWPPTPTAWVLHPGAAWHGFGDIEDDYCMLDPIKVSVVTPGVAVKGGLDKRGIPATLVTAYLHRRGVEVEKTTDFTILFLFSIGITKGKWGTLLNALLDFKRDYDRNAPLTEVLPSLATAHPDVYGGLGLRDLAGSDVRAAQGRSRQTHWLAEAFSTLPTPGR